MARALGCTLPYFKVPTKQLDCHTSKAAIHEKPCLFTALAVARYCGASRDQNWHTHILPSLKHVRSNQGVVILPFSNTNVTGSTDLLLRLAYNYWQP